MFYCYKYLPRLKKINHSVVNFVHFWGAIDELKFARSVLYDLNVNG